MSERGEKDMFRVARAILKRVGERDDELTLRVAVESDKAAARLSGPEKTRLVSLVQDHQRGIVPIPQKGTSYTYQEFSRIRRNAFEKTEESKQLTAAVERFRRILEEIGSVHPEAKGVFSPLPAHHTPLQYANRMQEDFWHALQRDVATTSEQMVEGRSERGRRTPEAVRRVLKAYRAHAGTRMTQLEVLSQPWLYDASGDPGQVFEALETAGLGYELCPQILKRIHKISFGRGVGDTIPTYWDVNLGRASIQEVIEKNRERERQGEQRQLEFERRRIEGIQEVSAFIAAQYTTHLGTLNRRLKERFGIRVEKRPHADWRGGGVETQLCLPQGAGLLRGPTTDTDQAVVGLLLMLGELVRVYRASPPALGKNEYLRSEDRARAFASMVLAVGMDVPNPFSEARPTIPRRLVQALEPLAAIARRYAAEGKDAGVFANEVLQDEAFKQTPFYRTDCVQKVDYGGIHRACEQGGLSGLEEVFELATRGPAKVLHLPVARVPFWRQLELRVSDWRGD